MIEIEYVDAIDIDGTIKVRKDIGLLGQDNEGKYFTTRVDFKKYFGTLEQYMKTAYEIINKEEFTENELKIMKQENYEGKYIYKIVLENGEVLTHEYTFMGFESEDFKVVPTKIPTENQYTVDPRKVICTGWYYIKNNKQNKYMTLNDL